MDANVKLLSLHHVSWTPRTSQVPIVSNISFDVFTGQVIAIRGHNGAGKSTLIRLIAGLLHGYDGRVDFARGEARPASEYIGYMPDDFVFAGKLSARETLLFWANVRGLGVAARNRVNEVLAEVGLAEVANNLVSTYSKGMRQRLLFAQALLGTPKLLLLDEPTNGLDPMWRDAFVELVRAARNCGQAVLFSTHQLDVAQEVADQIWVMERGNLTK